MPITSIGENLFQLPHVSGEVIKASAGAIEMSCFKGQGKLKPMLQMADKPVPEVQGGKIVTANSKLAIAYFATPVNNLWNEFGGLDQIITLFSKPDSNTLIFDYDSTNLVPYHQPPLTQAEIAEGSIRPDHVINSLAWYHTSKGGLVSPSDVTSRITTGKAQHWYRQVVEDALGKKSWADWIILNASQVGLVLDDKFMSTAVYPVVIAPVGDTFGYTSQGSGSLTLVNPSPRANRFNCPAAGTATSISVGIYASTTGLDLKAGIYNDDANKTKLQDCVENTDTGSGVKWITENFNTSDPTISVTNYWLACAGNGSTIYVNNDSTGGTYLTSSTAYASMMQANLSIWSSGGSAYKISIYCTYTPAGGGWANIKNIRAGTGTITATDVASIWFGTGEVAVADIAEIPVGVVV